VWAYHDTSDDIENNWQKHTEKGFHRISLLMAPREPPVVVYVTTEVTDYVTTEPPTSGATVMAASIVGNLLFNYYRSHFPILI